MDLTYEKGEWLMATEELVRRYPSKYIAGKLYQIREIKGTTIYNMNEAGEKYQFGIVTLQTFLKKTKGVENELWT